MMNSYIISNYSYFHADKSRDVINVIFSVSEFIEKFKHTPYEFSLDDEYLNKLDQCSRFLETRGSTIPEGFGNITLVYRPIFIYTNQYFKKENKNYKLKLIGEGAYANVYTYIDEEYSCKFALKKLKTNATSKDFERFKREYDLMKKYKYPYITKVLDSIVLTNHIRWNFATII